jgi:hypothetical protein
MLPRWRRDGRELFFVDGANRFMVVDVAASDSFVSSSLPVALFNTCLIPAGPDQRLYDVALDGSRSLWLCPTPPKQPSLVNVFLDWASPLEEAKR